MQHNVGGIDAGIRLTLAAVFFGVSLVFNASLALTLLTAVATVALVATALMRSCPLYSLLGLSTCPRVATHGPR